MSSYRDSRSYINIILVGGCTVDRTVQYHSSHRGPGGMYQVYTVTNIFVSSVLQLRTVNKNRISIKLREVRPTPIQHSLNKLVL